MKQSPLHIGITLALMALSGAAAAGAIGTVTIDGQTAAAPDLTQDFTVGADGKTVSIFNQNDSGIFLNAGDGSGTILGRDISISTGYDAAIWVQKGAKLVVGNASTERLTLKSDTAKNSIGATSQQGSSVTLNAREIYVSGNDFGLLAQTNTQLENPTVRSELIVNADKTTVVSKDVGLGAFSNGKMVINGDLTVTAPKVIEARGHSILDINPDGKGTVVLNGDIAFATPGPNANSGTVIEADVSLNLTGPNSVWTGGLVRGYPVGTDESKPELTESSGFTLKISDGAQWNAGNVTDSTDQETNTLSKAQNVNFLVLNDGIINVGETGQKVVVEELSGTGGSINVATEIDKDGNVATGGMTVETVKSEGNAKPHLNVTATGITADDLKDAETEKKVLEAVYGSVAKQDGGTLDATRTNTVVEGDVKGAVSQTVDATGQVTGTVHAGNTKLSRYGTTLSIGAVQWRHEINDLSKRMGELRDMPAGVGSWARIFGSEQEYGSLVAKNTTIQVGGDFDAGAGWKLGGAFSYTDGSSTATGMESDTDMYGLAVYGTWFGDTGLFLDLTGRWTRMDTDFEAGNMKGDYDNNALSASVEAGWRLPVTNLFFVEPQVEMTWGRVFGDDFKASNGVKVSQDDADALIGRVGLRAGITCPENKGTLYVRASALHDFEGEIDSVATKAGQSERIHDDIGGTWYEFGVGGSLNVTPDTQVYVDLERTTGGELVENWRWNVGVRHVW